MSEMNLTEKLSLALECKQYRELIERLYDDLAAVKKAHKEALEFNYDLAEENTAIHTKAIAMQERISSLERIIKDCNDCIQAARIEGLDEALAETSDERLKDLVMRRLLWVEHYCAGYLGEGK